MDKNHADKTFLNITKYFSFECAVELKLTASNNYFNENFIFHA